MSDAAIIFGIHVEIGVHEVKFHSADVDSPDVGVNSSSGERHFKNHGLAIITEYLFDRQLIEVLGLIVGYLLAIQRESLGEVSMTIKETYGRHVDTTVRSLLDVVTGENSETTGIYFKTIAKSIFHTEICY